MANFKKKLAKELKLSTYIENSDNYRMTTTCVQQRIKKIAITSQFTKDLADFLSVFYLLTLVPKPRNFSYTQTLCFIITNR